MVSRRFITFLMRFIKLMRFVLLKERKASNIKRRGGACFMTFIQIVCFLVTTENLVL